jgi:hypothetical protein
MTRTIAETRTRCRELTAKIAGEEPPPEEPPPLSSSPSAQWTALKQELLRQGYSSLNADEAIARTYPGLWELASAEIARTTSPGGSMHKAAPPPQKGAPMERASDILLDEARKLVAQGQAADLTAALAAVSKAYPQTYARYQKEGGQRLPVAKDLQQLTPPDQTDGQRRYEVLKARLAAKHPDWSEAQLYGAVAKTAEGEAALAQHRRQHLFRKA